MKTVQVVAAVITRNGKILATQRGYGEFKGGWEFPGGKVEPGEFPEESLKREICEELNTEIKIHSLIDTVEYDYPTFHLSMKCYWCSVINGNLELLEHEASRWLDKDDLYSVAWLPADEILLEKIRIMMQSDLLSDESVSKKSHTLI